MTSVFKNLMYVLMIAFISACGGGGSTPPPENLSPITSFTSSAATITTGASVDLSPVFTSESTATIDNGIGVVTSGNTYTVSPTSTTIYTLTATKPDSTTFTSEVTVTVVPAPTFTSFTSSAATITAGDSVDLTAVFANGTGVIDNGVGVVTSGAAKSVSPTTTTTYSLIVTNAAGTAFSSPKTITVIPAPTITSFTPSSSTILDGAGADLTAVFANGTGSVNQSVGAITSGVSKSVTPSNSTTYTLTVTNAAGATVTSDTTVDVLGLTSLSVENANLDQVFQSNQSAYTSTVGFMARSIRIKATTDIAGATVKVNNIAVGTDSYSNLIELIEGVNAAIDVTVTKDALTETYTLTMTRNNSGSFAQQAYIKASNTDAQDAFGVSVSISGDTMVVGASGDDSNASGIDGNQADNSMSAAGSAYVFTRSGTTWTQQAYLKASNPDIVDSFGRVVAIDGDTIAVTADREDSSAAGINGDQSDNSAGDAGAVYIFTRSGTTWTQQAYVKASNPDISDGFGFDISLHGDTLAVSTISEDSDATGIDGAQINGAGVSATGAVYVFTRNGTDWSQEAYIKASNTDDDDQFGRSISLHNNTLAVGTQYEDSNATGINGDQSNNTAGNAGAVYVFTRTGTTWSQQAYIKGSNTEANDLFGRAVSIHGDTLAVTAPGEDSDAVGVNGDESNNNLAVTGAAYIFVRNGTTWTQEAYIKASNPDFNDDFGLDINLSGDSLLIASSWEDSNATGINGNQADNSMTYAGAVYAFTRTGTTWSQSKYIKASNTDASDYFGYSISIAGDTVVSSAYFEDSNATGINGNQADNSLLTTGAVYVFE